LGNTEKELLGSLYGVPGPATLLRMAPFEIVSAPNDVRLDPVREVSQLPPQLRQLEGLDLWILHIPEGRVIEERILLRAGHQGKALLVLWCEARSHTKILVEVTGDSTAANVVLYQALDDEAACELIVVQAMDSEGGCSILQSSFLGAGSQLRSIHVSLGGQHSVHGVNVMLQKPDARSDIEWICYAKGNEEHHLDATNWFDASQGRGEIIMRSVAEQKAVLSAKGKIGIGLSGRGTDAYLTQEVLMLDASAKVHSVPALEIKTNDVKASHSATIARVTKEDLFYLASRGIVERDARRMFVLGFLGQLTGKIEDEGLRERIVQRIEGKYKQNS
jgi:Fe-S cluster assembly scaffold protein SufB